MAFNVKVISHLNGASWKLYQIMKKKEEKTKGKKVLINKFV